MRDFYEILNVDRDASLNDIKRSYRKLAKDCHPDLNPDDPDCEARFKEITTAYEVLVDEDKRQIYIVPLPTNLGPCLEASAQATLTE